MKIVSRIVKISFEQASKNQNLDIVKIKAQLAAGDAQEPVSEMNIIVSQGKNKDGTLKEEYVLTGEMPVLESFEAPEVEKVQKQIINDGGDKKVLDILNGDGLPLYYTRLITSQFMVKRDRVSVQARIELESNKLTEAVVWASANQPSLLASVNTPEGKAKLFEAFASK